ncbi:hypothetical protein PRIPAC_80779 [Pristionchus pacificus]|uniref:Uncharacterized protein n=1 Tax=Pristionchus pacificus TaxID=54126 RepID=A0A2A6BXG1_PRIPA|nr:hypothetical protein PRIPAC_80779 [Pristionchus pacificus]|eukprot:PDM70453.1 hypothetical protein PRIPAC_46699 [Pristionchus pacificus]
MEASDKHNKSHDTSSSGQAESSSNERGAEGAVPGDNHAAEFGNAGAWPVDPKHEDSAGPPVRKAPEPVHAEEKKEGKKRRKKSKEKETKDQEGKQVKKLLQPSSSSGHSERAAGKRPKIKDHKVESKDNKPPEKSEDCTTKRNLHMIKTERVGGHTEDEEEAVIAKEEKKIKKRKEKKRSKKKTSGEKIEEEEAKQIMNKRPEITFQPSKFKKKKKEVELSSIHIDKEPPARPLVERAPIKTIPNYANIPETTLMRQLKPPVDPNRNRKLPSFTPSNFIADERTVTITEPSQGEKKTTTEQEKKEQQQISTAQELSMVTEKESNMTKFKRRVQNPSGWLWLVIGALVVLCIILIVLFADLYRRNVALAEEVEQLKNKSGK